jgi:hypothetical protein
LVVPPSTARGAHALLLQSCLPREARCVNRAAPNSNLTVAALDDPATTDSILAEALG